MGGSIAVNSVGCTKPFETAQGEQSVLVQEHVCLCVFIQLLHILSVSSHALGLFLHAVYYSILCIYVGLRLILLSLLHVCVCAAL